MKKKSSLSLAQLSLAHPIALTIGNFDGVHRGHSFLFQKMLNLVGPQGSRVVITFRNHPLFFFTPNHPPFLLTSFEEKLTLLEQEGIDLCYTLTFDKILSEMSYFDFLSKLHRIISFDYLVLGEHARFGKNKEGTEENVTALAKTLGYVPIYLSPLKENSQKISSQKIRSAILEGNCEQAATWLGHPLTVAIDKKMEPHTPHIIEVDRQRILPPDGSYQVVCELTHTRHSTMTIVVDAEKHQLVLPSSHTVNEIRSIAFLQ